MIRCTFEDDIEVLLRHVTVIGIVTNEKNQILLNLRAVHLLNGNKYGLIGGFLDRDEDTKTCMLRELKEEADIEGKILKLFAIKDNPDRPQEDRQNVEFVYIVQAASENIKGSLEGDVYWFSFDKLPKKEQFAFDHYETILRYKKYLKKKFALPFVGKI